MERLYFHTPDFSELWYHQKLLSDTHTMHYYKIFNDFFCFNLDENNLRMWYNKWVNAAPVSYFAYIVSVSDKKFIGEVYLHKNQNADMYDDYYDMGINIEDQYRGHGYGKGGIRAFD